MDRREVNDSGLSPVVGVILMVSLTVMLSGVVYMVANSYTDMAQGGLDFFSIRAKIYTRGITETYQDGSPTGYTFSGLMINVMEGTMVWEDYLVLIDSEKVYTLRSDRMKQGSVPDGNSEPAPVNSGVSSAGDVQWFSEEGYRSDLTPLTVHDTYTLKLIHIESNKISWQVEIDATV